MMRAVLVLFCLLSCNARRRGKTQKDPMSYTDEDYLRQRASPQNILDDSVCSADGWTDFATLPKDRMGITTFSNGFRFKQVVPGGNVRPSVKSPVMLKFTGRLLKKRNAGNSVESGARIMVPQGGQKLTIEQPVEHVEHALSVLREISIHLGFKTTGFDESLQNDFRNLFLSQREGSIWKMYMPENLVLGEGGTR